MFIEKSQKKYLNLYITNRIKIVREPRILLNTLLFIQCHQLVRPKNIGDGVSLFVGDPKAVNPSSRRKEKASIKEKF